jgi:hypothetical protein
MYHAGVIRALIKAIYDDINQPQPLKIEHVLQGIHWFVIAGPGLPETEGVERYGRMGQLMYQYT